MSRGATRGSDRAALEKLASRLHSSAIHLLRRLRGEDVKSGLGPARLSALSVVVFAGPVSLRKLAAAEQVKPPTMTRIVQGLERENLVSRQADSRDGRVIQIRATRKGIRAMERARNRRLQAFVALLHRVEGREREVLAEAAEILESLLRRSRSGAAGTVSTFRADEPGTSH
jgi:DNA-binding MarR family transcriptional regulator